MARLDARCKTRIPVVIIIKGEGRDFQSFASNLGLGGAFINSSLSLPENTQVRLKAPLPGGEFEVDGKVLRREENGVAVKFLGVEEDAKAGLWEYIKENMEKTACPFCGAALPAENARCSDCGMTTDLARPGYLEKYQNEQVAAWCSMLDMETERFLGTMDELEAGLLKGRYEHDVILKKTHDAIEEILSFCAKFARNVRDRELIIKKQDEFNNKTDYILSKSYFMNHARVWPKGYQGDYKMLEGIYRNIPLSEGIGYYLDCYLLAFTLSRACRGRLDKAKRILKGELLRQKGRRILDIGCGSSRDLFEIAEDIRDSNADITCIDIDDDALRFSLNRLAYAGLGDQIKFRKYNVVRMINRERNLREFGKQEIIYSAGVFNYLPDDIVPNLIDALYELLNPGGRLIIAFEDADRYRPQNCHWGLKWDALIQRTEIDCRALFEAAGFPEGAMKIKRDETGVIMFCILER
ncbi:MAG: methyltransferase [Nitrospiraceae bacterium]|nr:methyltransferase [Nitrospiraceae bacterium]